MAWVMAVLGAALAVGGGVALWSGSGFIRLDWGQAETVAGTVALSAGIVTVGVAAVLFALRDAVRELARRPAPDAVSVVRPGAGVGLEVVHLGDEVDRDDRLARPVATGRLDHVGAFEDGHASPIHADPAYAEPGYAEPAVAPPAPPPVRREIGAAYGSRHGAVPDAVPLAVPEAPRPAAPTVAEAPTVVGRYEANGASYVLFSDGTIEVETASGTHRFASMADLKDHIERQEAV